MKEIKAIIQAYEQAEQEGKKSALVTVVHLEGSSYRRPGARMLVTDEGEMTGAISGGCLEGDALRKALSVLNQQQSRLVTYDTSDEEDASIGVQLGCAGVIQVLMEPIDHARANHPVELLKKLVGKRQPYVLVTLFSLEDKKGAQPGTCLLVEADGTVSGDMTVAALKQVVLEDVTTCFDQKQSAFRNYRSADFAITAFIEYIEPALALMIIGAGNDVIPLVEMANTLGWEPSVIDGRPTHAKRERFASACQILVSKPEKVLEQLVIDEQTVFVLMTHNYNYDLAMLKALVHTSVPYIGLLGPKKKLDRMLGELKAECITLTEEQLSRIYGPVGLEIGAETAEEIALSILAEIRAVKTGTGGKSLRTKEDTIHSREATRISEKHIQ
ncbi:XdhC family protein [Flavihumibacter cheonanensis]|uniref:XdhC family protein n=1 Tax=Flavihumibacter cheonanensis TaxID=1442385 RepID=UPI001EF98777|nr:XdhC/CoxI family protein [Flavihumibacter cheonanensis]MCG7753979.1 XdhC family protein [Flavihumibacter cheonanensis]